MSGAPRRAIIVCAALIMATALLHRSLAAALVTRGDALAANGDTLGALAKYRLALSLDSTSVIAADRAAFMLVARHEHAAAREAIAIATGTLTHTIDDPGLLVDRGLAELQVGERRSAARDLARAAQRAQDPRFLRTALRVAQPGDRVRTR